MLTLHARGRLVLFGGVIVDHRLDRSIYHKELTVVVKKIQLSMVNQLTSQVRHVAGWDRISCELAFLLGLGRCYLKLSLYSSRTSGSEHRASRRAHLT